MKELVIISGKGGTGKTSLTASFAALAGRSVLADCDVDAADLHLLLHPEIKETHLFSSGHEAVIESGRCNGCWICRDLCRFHAINMKNNIAQIIPYSCEGCKVCVNNCPENAITFQERICGEWYESETLYGSMIHAKLYPGAENSGKLVSQVRKSAKELAKRQGTELILVDGPPGIGCPVIASVGGASAILAVTEPTVSGEHDLERVLKLARHFEIPAMVCVNKWNLNAEATVRIETNAVSFGALMVGRIPYDGIFTKAMCNGKTAIDYAHSDVTENIEKIWTKIYRTILL
ncbi:MAG: 4Fe-4S binding protein [Bacilli bacterium]|jgi:MinD superfamily P-loop ATPase